MATRQSFEKLDPVQKVAVLFLFLGPELSGQIGKLLSEGEMERIAMEMAKLRMVSPEQRREVITEFYEKAKSPGEEELLGGMETIRNMLQSAFGVERGRELEEDLFQSKSLRPFAALERIDPQRIFSILQGESPQVSSLVLAFVSPRQSAAVLSHFPPHVQGEISRRVAMLDQTNPEVIAQVETVLMKKLGQKEYVGLLKPGGPQALADVLREIDAPSEKRIMDGLERSSPPMAADVRSRVLQFDDLMHLDEFCLRKLVQACDQKILVYALKAATPPVREWILKAYSSRSQKHMLSDMQSLGAVKRTDCLGAQKRVLEKVRELEEAGEIYIIRSGQEEWIT